MVRRRVPAALLIAAAALALSACGNKQAPANIHFGPTEGVYVTAGDLKYQIQISRQLNEYSTEDGQYLMGVPQSDRKLRNNQTWFGVFIRVENPKGHDLRASQKFTIVDTLGETFKPFPISQSANPIAYYPAKIPPHQILPNSNALAAQTSINGELLLFKLPVGVLDNRPLTLHIAPGPHQQGPGAIVDLDV
jgi:hypothetical protein